jgi:translocation and assembly module TamB
VAVVGRRAGRRVWYLGRETTLQMIAQRVANASGGKLTLSGVSGSLYGHMHIGHVVFRTETSVMTADDIDIDWKPWQYLSRGVEIDKLYAKSLRMETLKESTEPATMPTRLAPPFKIAVEDARLAKAIFVNKGAATEIDDIRARLHGDKAQWKLDYASANTPWGQVAAKRQHRQHAAVQAERGCEPDAVAARGAGASGRRRHRHAAVAGRATEAARGGDLQKTVIDASGQAARAQGTAQMVMSPFADIPLQAFTLECAQHRPGLLQSDPAERGPEPGRIGPARPEPEYRRLREPDERRRRRHASTSNACRCGRCAASWAAA